MREVKQNRSNQIGFVKQSVKRKCRSDTELDLNHGALKGIRIPVSGLKGRCPWPLDDEGMQTLSIYLLGVDSKRVQSCSLRKSQHKIHVLNRLPCSAFYQVVDAAYNDNPARPHVNRGVNKTQVVP